MTKKTLLIASLDRIEKILLFNLISQSSEEIEIVGIVTDFSPQQVITFLERDSNHGKFMVDKILFQSGGKGDAKLIFLLNDGKKRVVVNLYQEKELKLIKWSKEIDFILDLSPSLKLTQLNFYQRIAEKVLVLEETALLSKNKKPGKKLAYHFNHGLLEQEEGETIKTIYLPPIEAVIFAILLRSLKDKFKISDAHFHITVGPNNTMVLLDRLSLNSSQLVHNRSIFNNIIPSNFEFIKNSAIDLLNKENFNFFLEGDGCYVPATTGGFIKLLLKVEKSFNDKEINERLSQEADAQIGFSKKNLVSQDIVATHYYAIIDQETTHVSDNKEFVTLGLWYDYESSFAISIFKLLQYLSGLELAIKK